ncbi:hypothetical protein ZWY2020_036915 [Hordeum vulgare]|nr:hypothetical protein ZWY2020_036915 [Hordeum vulgare]
MEVDQGISAPSPSPPPGVPRPQADHARPACTSGRLVPAPPPARARPTSQSGACVTSARPRPWLLSRSAAMDSFTQGQRRAFKFLDSWILATVKLESETNSPS